MAAVFSFISWFLKKFYTDKTLQSEWRQRFDTMVLEYVLFWKATIMFHYNLKIQHTQYMLLQRNVMAELLQALLSWLHRVAESCFKALYKLYFMSNPKRFMTAEWLLSLLVDLEGLSQTWRQSHVTNISDTTVLSFALSCWTGTGKC